jgi:hypothetical protein
MLIYVAPCTPRPHLVPDIGQEARRANPALGAARPLITALRAPAVQASISNLGGYDLEPAGAVESLAD